MEWNCSIVVIHLYKLKQVTLIVLRVSRDMRGTVSKRNTMQLIESVPELEFRSSILVQYRRIHCI